MHQGMIFNEVWTFAGDGGRKWTLLSQLQDAKTSILDLQFANCLSGLKLVSQILFHISMSGGGLIYLAFYLICSLYGVVGSDVEHILLFFIFLIWLRRVYLVVIEASFNFPLLLVLLVECLLLHNMFQKRHILYWGRSWLERMVLWSCMRQLIA